MFNFYLLEIETETNEISEENIINDTEESPQVDGGSGRILSPLFNKYLLLRNPLLWKRKTQASLQQRANLMTGRLKPGEEFLSSKNKIYFFDDCC